MQNNDNLTRLSELQKECEQLKTILQIQNNDDFTKLCTLQKECEELKAQLQKERLDAAIYEIASRVIFSDMTVKEYVSRIHDFINSKINDNPTTTQIQNLRNIYTQKYKLRIVDTAPEIDLNNAQFVFGSTSVP